MYLLHNKHSLKEISIDYKSKRQSVSINISDGSWQLVAKKNEEMNKRQRRGTRSIRMNTINRRWFSQRFCQLFLFDCFIVRICFVVVITLVSSWLGEIMIARCHTPSSDCFAILLFVDCLVSSILVKKIRNRFRRRKDEKKSIKMIFSGATAALEQLCALFSHRHHQHRIDGVCIFI